MNEPIRPPALRNIHEREREPVSTYRLFESSIFVKSLRQGLLGLFLWMVLSGGLIILLLYCFHQIAGSAFSEILNDMLRAFPEGMRSQFGLGAFLDFSSFRNYFSVAMQIMLLIGCIFASYLGTSSIIRFESDHSAAFIQALPVSRASVVLSKLVSQLCLLVIYNLFIFLIAAQASMGYVPDMGSFIGEILQVFFSFLAVEAVYLGLGILLSAFLTHLSQAAAAAFMLFIATMLFGVIGGAFQEMNWLIPFSPYYYTAVYPLMESGAYVSGGLLAGCAASLLVCAAIACAWYSYRNLDI